MNNLNNNKNSEIKSLLLYDLLKNLGIKTNNVKLYAEALTHNSYNHEKKVGYTYQRLEFLGDAIISKLISCYLYENKELNEQQMTDIRKNLVNAEILRKASDELNLINYAFVGNGVNKNNDTKKIKSDLFEAMIGAIYLDQGEHKAYEILQATIIKYYLLNDLINPIDYKTKIQELLHNVFSKAKLNHESSCSQDIKIPFYYRTELIDDKKFKASLIFCNKILSIGFGDSKKEAEKKAAQHAYDDFVWNSRKKQTQTQSTTTQAVQINPHVESSTTTVATSNSSNSTTITITAPKSATTTSTSATITVSVEED